MDFVRKVISLVQEWSEPETPDRQFVDEQSERLVELVIANAARATERARAANLPKVEESRVISALIDKLQDAGF
jgi:hypothetical protein